MSLTTFRENVAPGAAVAARAPLLAEEHESWVALEGHFFSRIKEGLGGECGAVGRAPGKHAILTCQLKVFKVYSKCRVVSLNIHVPIPVYFTYSIYTKKLSKSSLV